MKKAIGVSALALFLMVPLIGRPAGGLDLEQPYLLLATKKTKTMQKELDQASEAGYRLKVGSNTSGTEVMVLMERQPEGSPEYKYLLLATSSGDTMRKELNEAAADGFRIRPSTIINKRRSFLGPEILMILEKGPAGTTQYEYQVLATNKTSTLQKELTEVLLGESGFALIGMASPGEHFAILERPRQGSEGSSDF